MLYVALFDKNIEYITQINLTWIFSVCINQYLAYYAQVLANAIFHLPDSMDLSDGYAIDSCFHIAVLESVGCNVLLILKVIN